VEAAERKVKKTYVLFFMAISNWQLVPRKWASNPRADI